MSTLSLDLRGVEATHALPREAPTKGASLSLLVHTAFISTLILIPLLQSTKPPEVAHAVLTPLIRPILVALPPAPRAIQKEPARSLTPRASSASVAFPSAPTKVPDSLSPNFLDPNVVTGPAGNPRLGEPETPGLVGGDCPLGSLCGTALPPVSEPIKTVRIGGDIKEPRLLESRAPQYPGVAQVAGVSGRVSIEAHVGDNGRILEARIIESQPLFDDAALASVRSRLYKPLLLNGVPTDFLVTITIIFNAWR
ncbi:MAG: TonB family protein [Vicinamibacteria bacterium]